MADYNHNSATGGQGMNTELGSAAPAKIGLERIWITRRVSGRTP
ncbi:hypothetical protein [Methylomonas koyamae]|nr:hypothetical protein [Methylomonas koyamae]